MKFKTRAIVHLFLNFCHFKHMLAIGRYTPDFFVQEIGIHVCVYP